MSMTKADVIFTKTLVACLLIGMIFAFCSFNAKYEETTSVAESVEETTEMPIKVVDIPETEETIIPSQTPRFVYVEDTRTIEDKIWEWLHDFGFSDVVAAAIMGNMQVESGFREGIYGYYYGNTYYGLCQWNIEYTPQADGLDARSQCWLIRETLASAFESWHKGSIKGWRYYLDTFENSTNVKEAALIFAKAYERCGEGSYDARVKAAEKIFEERGTP